MRLYIIESDNWDGNQEYIAIVTSDSREKATRKVKEDGWSTDKVNVRELELDSDLFIVLPVFG